MTDQTTSPEFDRLRALHAEIPAPDPETVGAARERLRAAVAAPAGDDPAGSARPTGDGRPDHPAGTPRTSPGRTWPGRPRRRLVGAGLVAAATAAVVVGTTGVGGGVDVVARAEAALSTGGPVVHLVTSGGWVLADGTPSTTGVMGPGDELATLAPRIQSWAVERPLRFATRQDVVLPRGRTVGALTTGLSADGTYWERDAAGRGPLPQEDLTAEASADLAARLNNGLGADPTARIRRMLEDGDFRSAGETTVRGRTARRLVAETTDDGGRLAERTEYLVDADSFEPLDVRVSQGPGFVPASTVATEASRPSSAPGTTTEGAGAQSPGGPAGAPRDGETVLVQHVVVERFERLPLDATTARLFRVPAALERWAERARERAGSRRERPRP